LPFSAVSRDQFGIVELVKREIDVALVLLGIGQ